MIIFFLDLFTDYKGGKEKEIITKIKDIKGLINKQTKKNTVHFGCTFCYFKTTSNQHLKTRVKRKYTTF